MQDALVKLFRQRHLRLVGRRLESDGQVGCPQRNQLPPPKLGQSLDADEMLSDSLGEEQDPAERIVHEESTAIMRARIEALPDSWRQALVLREQQGLAYKDIADTLAATEAQVKTWLHRARARLLNLMADDEERKPGEKTPSAPRRV